MCPLCVHCFVSLLLQKLVNFPLTWFLTSPSKKYPYCPGFFHSPFHSSVHGPQGPQVKSLKFEIMYSSVSHLQCTALKNECFDFAATLECWILAVANWILLGPKLKQTKPCCSCFFVACQGAIKKQDSRSAFEKWYQLLFLQHNRKCLQCNQQDNRTICLEDTWRWGEGFRDKPTCKKKVLIAVERVCWIMCMSVLTTLYESKCMALAWNVPLKGGWEAHVFVFVDPPPSPTTIYNQKTCSFFVDILYSRPNLSA